MRIPTTHFQRIKSGVHVLQALLIFVAACVMIALFTKDGHSDGRNKFYFALCFLSIPGLLYLAMVPLWARTVRFANVYALLSIDVLYTILWLAAFAAAAAWNKAGVKEGAEKKKLPQNQANCTTFAYGSESKCALSHSTVGLGVTICLLFLITSIMSGYVFSYWRKNGHMPGAGKASALAGGAAAGGLGGYAAADGLESGKNDAWSHDTGDLDTPYGNRHSEESDGDHTVRGGDQEEDEYTLLHSTETDDGRHPGRPWSGTSGAYGGSGDLGRAHSPYGGDIDTGYRSTTTASGAAPYPENTPYPAGGPDFQQHHTPSALSPGGYDSPEAVRGFDEFRRGGAGGYSFSNPDDQLRR